MKCFACEHPPTPAYKTRWVPAAEVLPHVSVRAAENVRSAFYYACIIESERQGAPVRKFKALAERGFGSMEATAHYALYHVMTDDANLKFIREQELTELTEVGCLPTLAQSTSDVYMHAYTMPLDDDEEDEIPHL